MQHPPGLLPDKVPQGSCDNWHQGLFIVHYNILRQTTLFSCQVVYVSKHTVANCHKIQHGLYKA